jgi:hypothetical protein
LFYYLHDDPNLPLAWAPWLSHEYITCFSVQAVDRIMFMSLVPIKTNPVLNNTNWPIGAKHVDLYKESYRKYGQLDPLWSFSYSERNGEFGLDPPLGKTVEP